MTFYDMNSNKLNNGDLVLYRGKRYEISITDNGVQLSSDNEERTIEAKNNHIFKSIKIVDWCDDEIIGMAYES